LKNISKKNQIYNFIYRVDCWYLKQYFTGKTSLFRYYQNIFIKRYGNQCCGQVIEIGADKSYRYSRYFPNAEEYHFSNITKDSDMFLDVTNMSNLTDNSIDTIICISVLEHIWEFQQAMDEIERVLKPGGKLLLSTPFGFPEHDKIDYWRFSSHFYINGIKNFKLHSITSLGGRLSTIVNTLQRPCGKLTLRYFCYKLIGFVIAIIAIRLDVKDPFPLGYGIFAEKNK